MWYSASVMAYAIDTLAGAKDLEWAGVPDKQAEAIVHLITQQGEDLATKADITALRSDMATKADMAEMKVTLLIAMVALSGLVIAGVATVNKLL